MLNLPWRYANPVLKTILVLPEHTDRLGHTNNVCYLSWLEAIAWEHMEQLACGWAVNEQTGKAMAITRTEMDYLAASYADDELILGTWITASDYRLTSVREFELYRLRDKKRLLSARMRFACIDLKSGRASKMPMALIEAHKVSITRIG